MRTEHEQMNASSEEIARRPMRSAAKVRDAMVRAERLRADARMTCYCAECHGTGPFSVHGWDAK